ncbi:hypothetical protein BDY17DRAFT_309248 [Neohortaea acidophila]|uniref:BZIP domain-containing protein n=1 Tax=Neohortaea acidophila TaxID=245834 RepID=A0A6A6PV95_9PEZI|nr:uncharacterized protein BDY17DRAFT_309248 [Neohortaea acidophila]KAF2483885.1 hypothetical protein BDY17DRAFT_309248 [Neohortaea acidophila]
MATASVVHPRQPSSSASPTTSYSSHTGQASPASRYESTGLTTLSGPYTTNGEIQIGGARTASAFEQHHPASIPISSSGAQSVYQMMTLETSSGTVQLPVDVQAASRVADEKRRRNAGASARFRQRRKEKEREAATTIAALQQDVKELSEQVTFYRGERTYFAQVLSQMPGGERHLSRPPSPRHHHRRHHAMPPHPPSDSEGYGYTSMPDHEARSPNEGRNVRRRTSAYSLPPPPPPPPQQQPPSMPPPPPQAVFHGQPGRGTAQSMSTGPLPSPLTLEPLPPPPSHFAPSSFAQQQQQQQGPPGPPPPVMQAYPQPGPFNPYAPDRRTSGAPGPKREG